MPVSSLDTNSALGSKSFPTFGERHGGGLGVDGVEDSLIADLGLRDQADLGPQIRDPRRHRDLFCKILWKQKI